MDEVGHRGQHRVTEELSRPWKDDIMSTTQPANDSSKTPGLTDTPEAATIAVIPHRSTRTDFRPGDNFRKDAGSVLGEVSEAGNLVSSVFSGKSSTIRRSTSAVSEE